VSFSAVIGRADVMDSYAQSSMTTTHSASPVATAAALTGAFAEVLG
jgi:4-aminobutyrate aminotransferase-like enzyme